MSFINPADTSRKHDKVRFLKNIIYSSNDSGTLYIFPWFGGDERSLPTECDYNIIYRTDNKKWLISGYEGLDTIESWKNLGFDRHSTFTDPMFVDPENHDYNLNPDSPALKMGFKPIDISRVGLRGRK